MEPYCTRVYKKRKTHFQKIHIILYYLFQGRKREEVQFVEANVDTSLGNIRENIRKGANQKHISTSMVDPLKQMKKSGKILAQFHFHFFAKIKMTIYPPTHFIFGAGKDINDIISFTET